MCPKSSWPKADGLLTDRPVERLARAPAPPPVQAPRPRSQHRRNQPNGPCHVGLSPPYSRPSSVRIPSGLAPNAVTCAPKTLSPGATTGGHRPRQAAADRQTVIGGGQASTAESVRCFHAGRTTETATASGTQRSYRPAASSRSLRQALSCVAARGGRLHSPDDAQVEPREADVRRRAAAFVGHRAAGSPRKATPARHPSARCLWRRLDHRDRRRAAIPLPRTRSSGADTLSRKGLSI